MDALYNLPVCPESKLGLGLFESGLSDLPSSTTLDALDNEQLLALDDPQSIYLAFTNADAIDSCEETTSGTSLAVTPISECSSRTTFSVRNASPVSDNMSYHDNSDSQDFEAMLQDAAQSLMSSQYDQTAAVSWTSLDDDPTGLHRTLVATQHTPHHPQSFYNRNSRFADHDGTTPPAPSSYFTSPSLSSTRSPFVSPGLQPPLILPQNHYSHMADSRSNLHAYYSQPQPQPQPSPMFFQRINQNLPYQMHLHQPSRAQPQTSNHRAEYPNMKTQNPIMHSFLPQQLRQHQHQHQAPPQNQYLASSLTQSAEGAQLPHTTGNSATGYQCFSHGCGGRHFSNWGNLVRHHRERQLRSKAEAKPTCPRCGKGFTRSSARDAHVTGLKCVLGRRKRGGVTGATATEAGVSDSDIKARSASDTDQQRRREIEEPEDHEDSTGEIDVGVKVEGEAGNDDDYEEDEERTSNMGDFEIREGAELETSAGNDEDEFNGQSEKHSG